MPILTTATRSLRTPASPPMAIGTARTTVACSMPVSEKALPAVAQTRKAAMMIAKPMPSAQEAPLPVLETHCLTPRKARRAAAIQVNGPAGTTRLGSAQGSFGRDRRNTASPSACAKISAVMIARDDEDGAGDLGLPQGRCVELAGVRRCHGLTGHIRLLLARR